MIKVDLGRSCFLLLTAGEYERGLHRGKAARRKENYRRRELRLAERGDG